MKISYEIITPEFGQDCVKATLENGIIMLIPMDEANSDYQAYLKSLEDEA